MSREALLQRADRQCVIAFPSAKFSAFAQCQALSTRSSFELESAKRLHRRRSRSAARQRRTIERDGLRTPAEWSMSWGKVLIACRLYAAACLVIGVPQIGCFTSLSSTGFDTTALRTVDICKLSPYSIETASS
jgi:hypothetical protein